MIDGAQTSLELLLVLGGILVVAVIVLVTLQNSGASTGSNLIITNAKSACHFLQTQSACDSLDIQDLELNDTTFCAHDCCWDAATLSCSLNPLIEYQP